MWQITKSVWVLWKQSTLHSKALAWILQMQRSFLAASSGASFVSLFFLLVCISEFLAGKMFLPLAYRVLTSSEATVSWPLTAHAPYLLIGCAQASFSNAYCECCSIQYNRSGVQVLLKRYLLTQAFINVLAALAQYFRRVVAGWLIRLDMETCVEYIHKWMLQEVWHIATMTETSLREAFAHMWKFDTRWCQVLEPPLARDLQELQVYCRVLSGFSNMGK